MNIRIFTTAALLAFSSAAFAEGPFTLQFDNPAQDGGFKPEHLLSASYGFGCSGGNASPAISWQNPPADTKSFVLTVYDKNAPTGLGWVHWVVARYSRRCPPPARRYHRTRQKPAARRATNPHRFRPTGLRRRVSARRPQTPLRIHTDRAESGTPAEHHRRCHPRAGGLLHQGQQPGRSQIHSRIPTLTGPARQYAASSSDSARTAEGAKPKRSLNRAAKREGLS